MVPQVKHPTQATLNSDAVVQLTTICDSAFYAYLSKIANTAEKRRYLHASCTVIDHNDEVLIYLSDVDTFLDHLHELQALGLHHSIFQPDDIRILLFTLNQSSNLWQYFRRFRSDPERSREFHSNEDDLWCTFAATRYMKYLRMSYNPR